MRRTFFQKLFSLPPFYAWNYDKISTIHILEETGLAQLYFRYGTMNSGKSIEILKVAYNYEEQGKTSGTIDQSFG